MKIEELGPPDADHSTGLILHWREQLLFALEPRHQWRQEGGTWLARLVGIGGHLEPGESWTCAVQREAMEEAGLQVCLLHPERSYLLREDSGVQEITALLEWPDPPLPFFIWSATFRFSRPPHERVRHFVNAVFEAAVPDDAEPNPAAEMQAILAVSEAQLRRAVVQAVSLEELLDEGARIWESAPVPRSTRVVPGGTAQWYATWLVKDE